MLRGDDSRYDKKKKNDDTIEGRGKTTDLPVSRNMGNPSPMDLRPVVMLRNREYKR